MPTSPERIPTPEQRERFLEEIAEGKTRQEAAEAVGSTGTRFRTFLNGKSEENHAYAERYMAALEAAGNSPSPFAQRIRELEGVHLAHRLLDEAILRALDSERGKVGSSNRMLYNLALLNVESFKPLLEARTRHIHEGAVGIYAMPQIDTAKWSIEQHKEFVEIRQRMNELIALARPDDTRQPEMREIAAPVEEDEVIDVEAVEV